jgi:hypothetical protein
MLENLVTIQRKSEKVAKKGLTRFFIKNEEVLSKREFTLFWA